MGIWTPLPSHTHTHLISIKLYTSLLVMVLLAVFVIFGFEVLQTSQPLCKHSLSELLGTNCLLRSPLAVHDFCQQAITIVNLGIPPLPFLCYKMVKFSSPLNP